MIEQDLKNIWNKSAHSEHISIQTSRLIEELNAKMNNVQKSIRIRDLREISASVIGIIIFSFLLFEIPFPITRLSCILSILWFAYVIYKSLKSKKQNTISNWSLSITEQLERQKTAMQEQVDFLDSAAYWYAIPSFVTNIVFILGLGNPDDYDWVNSIAENILPLTINAKIITLFGLSVFYSLIIWINKRAAAQDIKPLIGHIETLENQLK